MGTLVARSDDVVIDGQNVSLETETDGVMAADVMNVRDLGPVIENEHMAVFGSLEVDRKVENDCSVADANIEVVEQNECESVMLGCLDMVYVCSPDIAESVDDCLADAAVEDDLSIFAETV